MPLSLLYAACKSDVISSSVLYGAYAGRMHLKTQPQLQTIPTTPVRSRAALQHLTKPKPNTTTS